MSMVCLFIYLNLLWFLLSAFCSFQHTSPVHVLLDLHLCISFFFGDCKWYYISVSPCSLLAHRNTRIFVPWSCSLWPCWTYLIVLGVFFGRYLEFFYIDNHVICKWGQFYFFLSDLYAIYFPFLPYWASVFTNKYDISCRFFVGVIYSFRKLLYLYNMFICIYLYVHIYLYWKFIYLYRKLPSIPNFWDLKKIILGGFLYIFLFFNKFIYFIYLFLAALGLCCCAQAFSSCGEQGLLFVAVCGLLTVVASLVVEHGSRCAGFSSCGTWAQ